MLYEILLETFWNLSRNIGLTCVARVCAGGTGVSSMREMTEAKTSWRVTAKRAQRAGSLTAAF
jgi:hypothetical protein